MPLALILGFVAYMIIWEAVHNEKPWSEIVSAFGGEKQPLGEETPPYQGGNIPPPPPGNGGGGGGGNITERCRNFEAQVKAHMPFAGFRGDFVCKCIKGTCKPSQHAWGNAVDYYIGDDRLFNMFVAWVNDHLGEFAVAEFLINEPSAGFVHVDFEPLHYGIPDCFGDNWPSSCVGCR